jgi:hypothetical protein
MIKDCCANFAVKAQHLDTPIGGTGLYSGPKPNGQFEKQEDGTWAINGCCGCGCFVVTQMKFRPFCGSELVPLKLPVIFL